ncbi:hypothetical protein DFH07DRAFT_835760 [Mycena maculata]|uniref:Uncharacterized protein n=1 Tax=Mycena maculata TaxID=230809 RepID=A0AAD7N2T9_9AGAR|nr:hypothetical protein DFH07DRAFT_835760 [Mycena maculata]
MMHSLLCSALLLIGVATSALAQNDEYIFFPTIGNPLKTEAKGLEGRVNGVNEWFKSSDAEWFSAEIGPIWQSKAGWRKIGEDDTAIVFQLNNSVPSPILSVALSNDTYMYDEYDFQMSFTYPSASASASAPTSRSLTKRDFWDDATHYAPVPFGGTSRTLTAATDACSDTVSITVTDAAGNVNTTSGWDSVQYTIPADVLFPLTVTMSSPSTGNSTSVLSDVLPISYAIASKGPILVTSNDYRVVFCLSQGD